MKIAILSPFYPFRGGLAQLNARLYTELSENNEVKAYTFTTLYPDILFPGKTQLVTEGDTAQVIDSIRVLNSINPLSYFKTARVINKFSPDILIIPYWMSFLAPAFGTVSRLIKRKTKVVALVHNAISHERTLIERPLAKYFLNSCDAFIVMSDLVKNDLLTLKKDALVRLQPHPIYDQYKDKTDRLSAAAKLNIDPLKKTLLFFGFIRDYKGLDLLIKSLDFLSEDYQLIIAGESYGSFVKYQELINESPLKNNINVFEQYINDDMVSLLFSAADVLVLPYKSATQSGVVAMAYQLETPVIATDVGALGKTVRDAQTGLVTKDVTAHSIAETIKDYFENDRSELFLENIRSEKKRLSWANFISDIENFFKNDVL